MLENTESQEMYLTMRCKRKTGWYVLLMSQMNVDIVK